LADLGGQAASGGARGELAFDGREKAFDLGALAVRFFRKGSEHVIPNGTVGDTPAPRGNAALRSQPLPKVLVIGFGVKLRIRQQHTEGSALCRRIQQSRQSARVAPRPLTGSLRQQNLLLHIHHNQPVGFGFAIAFAVLVTVGQVFAYSRGMRPSIDYEASRRPRLSRRQFWGTVVRTVGYTVTALICSAFIHHVDHAWLFAIRVGLVTGIVTGVGITVNPYIEYYADNLPERRLGVFGIGLILCGFSLQSLQYWLSLFDVRLT
jgi:hypothetical protein